MSQPLPAPLLKALEALLQIDWHFAMGAPESHTREAAWGGYYPGLRDQHYGRELSELEEEYERSRWGRAQLMLEHLDDFHQLIDAAFSFVVELSHAGGQRILGERARLPVLTKVARPSDWVQFGPIPPPEHPPLRVSEYEEIVGGPHVLGARLLWWCSAAKSPQEFGFSNSFSQSLWAEPIWTTSEGWKAEANRYPITLITTAAEKVVAVLKEVPPGSLDAPEAVDVELKDGPHPINQFRWKGKVAELTSTEWDLVNFLWTRRFRQAHYDDILRALWGGDTSDSAIETAASRASKSLKEQGIPVRVRVKSKHAEIVVKDG